MNDLNIKNSEIKIYIDGALYKRDEAMVSVFDSSVQGGDAVWEGIRIYKNKIFALDRHLNRLQESAKAMLFSDIPSSDKIKEAILLTLNTNGMYDNVHIRLTLTRGKKITSGMSTKNNKSGCTLIVLAEWKPPVYPSNGIKLITSAIRRNSPQCIDSKIHHNNLINNILAKIQAEQASADDALMLDLNGFVSETNATNIFMIKNSVVYTPHADSCLPGITRGIVIEILEKNNIPIKEKNLSLTEFYNADEVFTTGTMGELTPVLDIDGRQIVNKSGSVILNDIRMYFMRMTETEGEIIRNNVNV